MMVLYSRLEKGGKPRDIGKPVLIFLLVENFKLLQFKQKDEMSICMPIEDIILYYIILYYIILYCLRVFSHIANVIYLFYQNYLRVTVPVDTHTFNIPFLNAKKSEKYPKEQRNSVKMAAEILCT